MKTLILSNYDLVSHYIKEALSELQPYTINNCSWFKGKFYTKELYLADSFDSKDIGSLLDFLIVDGPISNVISVGLAESSHADLKQGDILINDYPTGSCQKLMDRFLNNGSDEFEDKPLRIFAGTIIGEKNREQTLPGLTCIDSSSEDLFATLQAKGLFTLAIRIITAEGNNSQLDSETINSILPKLLLLLKQTVEQVS